MRGRYSHDAIVDEAMAFIGRHQRERFFLYLPVTIPHAELQALGKGARYGVIAAGALA